MKTRFFIVSSPNEVLTREHTNKFQREISNLGNLLAGRTAEPQITRQLRAKLELRNYYQESFLVNAQVDCYPHCFEKGNGATLADQNIYQSWQNKDIHTT